MAERRPLIVGLKPVPGITPKLQEEEFVYGKTAPPGRRPPPESAEPTVSPPSPPAAAAAEPKNPPLTMQCRVPCTARLRQDMASALKRASLERQLAGTPPNSLQDILEEALEPWLKEHGYLP